MEIYAICNVVESGEGLSNFYPEWYYSSPKVAREVLEFINKKDSNSKRIVMSFSVTTKKGFNYEKSLGFYE